MCVLGNQAASGAAESVGAVEGLKTVELLGIPQLGTCTCCCRFLKHKPFELGDQSAARMEFRKGSGS